MGGKAVDEPIVYTDVFSISKFFLSKESMSNKKLQKLVYYAYVWTMTLLNEPEDKNKNKLFSSSIQAWVHGPVVPELYKEYKKYGWNKIPREEFDCKEFNEDVLCILEQVWDIYGDLSADQLENLTHMEEPWIIAREGYGYFEPSQEEICDSIIYEYYSKKLSEG